MALRMETLDSRTGEMIDCYWPIFESNFFWDPSNLRAHVVFAAFSSRDAFHSGVCEPYATIAFEWNGDDFPLTEERMAAAMGDTRRALYLKAREPLPDESPSPMANAIDIFE